MLVVDKATRLASARWGVGRGLSPGAQAGWEPQLLTSCMWEGVAPPAARSLMVMPSLPLEAVVGQPPLPGGQTHASQLRPHLPGSPTVSVPSPQGYLPPAPNGNRSVLTQHHQRDLLIPKADKTLLCLKISSSLVLPALRLKTKFLALAHKALSPSLTSLSHPGLPAPCRAPQVCPAREVFHGRIHPLPQASPGQLLLFLSLR